MKTKIIIAIFAVANIFEICADDVLISPFLVENIKEKDIKECRKEAGLSDDILEEAKKKATKCGFDFDQTPEYEHFHICLATKYGAYEEGRDDPVPEKVHKKWYFYDKAYVDKMIESCSTQLKDELNDNHRKYQLSVCYNIYAGDFPHGTKHVSIMDITPKMTQECRDEVRWTEDQLCKAYETTDHDAFDRDSQGMCYHSCLLEKLGFVKGTEVDRERVKKRFDYVSDPKFDRVYEKCSKSFNEDEKCAALYAIHRCLKESFGEYPVPIDKFT